MTEKQKRKAQLVAELREHPEGFSMYDHSTCALGYADRMFKDSGVRLTCSREVAQFIGVDAERMHDITCLGRIEGRHLPFSYITAGMMADEIERMEDIP